MPTPPVQLMAAYVAQPPPPPPPQLLALSLFADGAYLSTAGGEPGDAAGFGLAFGLAAMPRVNVNYACIYGRWTTVSNGHMLRVLGNVLSWEVVNGAGGNTVVSHQFYPSEMGRFRCVVATHEGTSIALYIDGKFSARTTISGYRAPSAAAYVGRMVPSISHPLTDVCLVMPPITWRGVLTEPAIKALSDSLRTTYDLPTSLAGVSLTHRHSLMETLSGKPAVDGQDAPASMTDTVTSAPADAWARTASPKLRVPDLAIDGSTRYGILPWDSYYCADDLIALTAKTVVHVRFTINAGVAANDRCIVSTQHTAGGFWIHSTGVNWRAGGVYSAAVAWNVTDYGVPMQLAFVHNGASATAYIKRRGQPVAVLGTTTSPIGATLSKLQIAMQAYYSTVNGQGSTFFDMTWVTETIDVPLSEVIDAMERTEKTNAMTGFETRPFHRYLPHLDVVANGGPDLPAPAVLLDRPNLVAPVNLTRVGTVAVPVSRRAERVFNYETTPIANGAASFSAANHFVSQAPVTVGNPPCWLTVGCVVNTASAPQVLASSVPSAAGAGMLLLLGTTNITFTVYNTAGTAYTVTLAAFPVLKRLTLISCYWNTLTARMGVALDGVWSNGAAPAAPTGIAPVSPLYLGREAAATVRAATGVSILGAAVGTGNLTAAQWQAQHEAWMAGDGAIVPGFSGLTSHQWRLVDADGTIPATVLDQVGGNPLTRIGAPTVEPYYVRAFAA